MRARRLLFLSTKERRMKVSEVIEKAISKEIRWFDAAMILGISERQARRWRLRYEARDVEGLADARQGKRPKNRLPDETAAKVLALYKASYEGFNAAHFHEQLKEHGLEVSYSWTKRLLLDTGCIARGPKRKAYRRRRDREPMRGMLVHLDGSKHRWFESDDGGMQDLLAYVDDATGDILAARFVPEESTKTVLALLGEVLEEHGTFGRLYTDRASHFVFTPKAGEGPDRSKKTQVERVCDDLGIELVCAYSPQARGRSERLWRTLQGRLPQELKRASARSYETANAYLFTRFLPAFRRRFLVAPTLEETAFAPISKRDLERIMALRFERVVGLDHTLRLHNHLFQLDKPKGLCPLQKRKVELRVSLDGRVAVYLGTRLLQTFQPANLDLDDPALDVN
jgi:transposase